MVELTENEVIDNLCYWLGKNGWVILEKSKGHSRGIDIKASRNGQVLIIEAKGSKGNPRSHVTTRPRFDSGQIKDHFGKAIVKVLEQKHSNPKAIIGIAQPNDDYLIKHIHDAAEEIRKMGIRLYWVESKDNVIVE